MKILSVTQMKSLEAAADAAGHSYDQMMEFAGQSVARAIIEHEVNGYHNGIRGHERRALVLVGPGNNGGDGLVAARYLSDAGIRVTAYLSRSRDAKKDNVYQQALEHGVTILCRTDDPEGQELRPLLTRSHVLIDALLGTGAKPPLKGTIADILKEIKETLEGEKNHPLTLLNRPKELPTPKPYIVAVDGPSGMDFDTGKVDPYTLKAHLTITFAYPKTGHVCFPAAEQSGDLVVADIGIPARVNIPGKTREIVTPDMIYSWLPQRPAFAHKGTFGKALIIAGSVNYVGAASLAAMAAVRSGAGLVTLAIPGSIQSAVSPLAPEATYLLLPNILGALTENAVPILEEELPSYDALLIGPGIGQAPETLKFISKLLGIHSEKRAAGFLPQKEVIPPPTLEMKLSMVVDADGLNLLSQLPDWPTHLPKDTILTPHPGEMARLTHRSVKEIQEDRWQTALEYAASWKHIVLLKGAFTVVAAPDGRAVLLPFANAGLAKAGTGDVLAGIIIALRAQGMEAFEAAVTGAYLHGLAGEIARQRHGETGMTSRDVAVAVPEALQRL